MPRSLHAQFATADQRPDPVALLESQAESRLAELVPVRYGRMLQSPFAFFRGAALIMASDLAGSPDSGIAVQVCGDAHLSNFGLFGTPERKMLFDINDFDETLPGPWEWDVKRLAASFEILGRHLGHAPRDRRMVVTECVSAYRTRMRELADQGTLSVWYQRLEAGALLNEVRADVRAGTIRKADARTAERRVAQAYTRDSVRVVTRRVTQDGAGLRFAADPPLIVPIEDLIQPGTEWEHADEQVTALLAKYRRSLGARHHPIEEFHYVHAARKVVGVGSVGTRCYIVLLVGRDEGDPLVLQVKEAKESVLERFLPRSRYRHHGERVVQGQRLMQAATDVFLGWVRITGFDGQTRDYYVRQLHDWKGSVEPEGLGPTSAATYSRLCGATLARAHARWGDRVAIAAYLGRGDAFDRAIAGFASAYADQNQRDYEQFAQAVEAGRIHAIRGV